MKATIDRTASGTAIKFAVTIRAYLAHLSHNMWSDHETPQTRARHTCYCPHLLWDEALWDELVAAMAKAGLNMVVLDLGDGVRWESHPEIAVEGAWSPQRLRDECARLRSLGLEPIPKFNFSTTHDAWMGPYSRMVSSPVYYDVCRDLIAEAIELFGRPRLFHLGYEEENLRGQLNHQMIAIRQFDLWWNDLFFLFDQAERGSARPWIWGENFYLDPMDPNDPDGSGQLTDRMPKKALISNWFYGPDFSPTNPRQRMLALGYERLEQLGYDQVPTVSNLRFKENARVTVEHCGRVIAPERLKGYIMTTWQPTVEEFRAQLLEAAEIAGREFPRE